MEPIKRFVQKLFRTLGFEISHYHANINTFNPFNDMRMLVSDNRRPVIFDIGANIGQSVKSFKKLFPRCLIHSFEFSPETYKILERNVGNYNLVFLNNLAVGNACGQKLFHENSNSDMSSFLKPGAFCWGEIIKELYVKVTTLDKYCENNNIEYINILKTDTQGYDLEVLKGAKKLMESNHIQMIFTEVIFSDIYEGKASFDEIFRFLIDNRYKLVSLYNFHRQRNVAGWADALFLNPEFTNI